MHSIVGRIMVSNRQLRSVPALLCGWHSFNQKGIAKDSRDTDLFDLILFLFSNYPDPAFACSVADELSCVLFARNYVATNSMTPVTKQKTSIQKRRQLLNCLHLLQTTPHPTLHPFKFFPVQTDKMKMNYLHSELSCLPCTCFEPPRTPTPRTLFYPTTVDSRHPLGESNELLDHPLR
jgi:hypothetical protein